MRKNSRTFSTLHEFKNLLSNKVIKLEIEAKAKQYLLLKNELEAKIRGPPANSGQLAKPKIKEFVHGIVITFSWLTSMVKAPSVLDIRQEPSKGTWPNGLRFTSLCTNQYKNNIEMVVHS